MTEKVTFRPYTPADYEFVYALKKLCYHDYVEALWGWNEDDQRRRFAVFMEEGAGEMMAILLKDGKAIGMTDKKYCRKLRGYQRNSRRPSCQRKIILTITCAPTCLFRFFTNKSRPIINS